MVGQAVLKNMHLLVHQIYLSINQKGFLNIGQLIRNREEVLWDKCKLQAVVLTPEIKLFTWSEQL